MIKKFFKIFFIFSILFLLIINSKSISNSLRTSIDICLYTIIPSLFSFMIFSNFIMFTNLSNFLFSPFNFLSKYIFKINKNYTYVIILSMIGGYPIGAKLIGQLLDDGKIDIKTANRMLLFCVNSGPAFLIGAVAVPIFNSYLVGFILFLSNIIACILIGFISSINCTYRQLDTKDAPQKTYLSYSDGLIKAVNTSIKALITISSFVLIFSVIINLLIDQSLINFLSNIFDKSTIDLFKNFFISISEVSNGIMNLTNLSTSKNILLIASAITSFGGVCVIFQIFAMLKPYKIDIKKFIIYRFIYTIISVTSTYFLIKLFNPSVESFSNFQNITSVINSKSPIVTVMLIVLSILLLLSTKKYDIICEKDF